MSGGGRFDFDDGGTYCGGWEDGKAHGHGVCTGPKGQGEYSGAWAYGFEASGVYTWPSGNCYEGEWMQGKRHGVGMESKGNWVYHGEWTQGFKGRYGVRASVGSGAKYEGTWTTGLQDGYGVETYADGGTYQGQWLRGMRHGYGVRASVPYGLASHYRPKTAMRSSLTSLRSEAEEDTVVKNRDKKVDESRGGFVLKARSDESPEMRRKSIFDKNGKTNTLRKSLMSGLKLRKQKSTGDIQDSPRRPTGSVRSTASSISHTSQDSTHSGKTNLSRCTDSNLSFVSQDDITDTTVTETYMGEWKNDKRSGFGISERSDGLKYEGEWYNNKKYGYGVTTLKDGVKEEGKYKNNILISSGKKSKIFLIRSSKMRERVDNALAAAQRAAQIAHQKADIAVSRMANARSKAEGAETSSAQARSDSELARQKAHEVAPDFVQPALDCAMVGSSPQASQHLDKNESTPDAGSAPSRNQQQNVSRDPPQRLAARDQPRRNDPSDHASSNVINRGEESSMLDGPTAVSRQGSMRRMQVPLIESEIAMPNSLEKVPNHTRTNSIPSNPRPQNSPMPERFSTLLNSNTVTDHFDQYRTVPKEDTSPLVREPSLHAPTRGSSEPRPQDQVQKHNRDNHVSPRYSSPPTQSSATPPLDEESELDMQYILPLDAAPLGSSNISRTAAASPTSEEEQSPRNGRLYDRRKTLPSLMKGVPVQPKPPPPPPMYDPNEMPEQPKPKPQPVVKDTKVEKSSEGPARYVIENGIRKRVKAEVYRRPSKPADPVDPPTNLPTKYKLESSTPLSKAGKKGSLPDVSVCKELGNNVMPRQEVSKLSAARRAEIIRMEEEEERRKQQEIVLRLADLKDWCQQRQLLMLVIAVNVSLATMFFNLLSQ